MYDKVEYLEIGRYIFKQRQAWLIVPFKTEDVNARIWSIHGSKSLKLDYYRSKFFLTWKEISNIILNFFKDDNMFK